MSDSQGKNSYLQGVSIPGPEGCREEIPERECLKGGEERRAGSFHVPTSFQRTLSDTEKGGLLDLPAEKRLGRDWEGREEQRTKAGPSGSAARPDSVWDPA